MDECIPDIDEEFIAEMRQKPHEFLALIKVDTTFFEFDAPEDLARYERIAKAKALLERIKERTAVPC